MRTVGVLSWGAHSTLWNTLSALRKYDVDKHFDLRIAFFQEYSIKDVEIANEFDYWDLGSTQNIGIADGFKTLVQTPGGSASDVFLFLENDWELVEPNAIEILLDAERLLTQGVADIVRLRSRHKPGHPLWSSQFQGREYDSPQHLLDSVHWEPNPEKFPQIEKNGIWYITSAKYANWTNNPIMFKPKWFIENIIPHMSGDVEKNIQSWWGQQDFKVAQGEGLFTHNRLDR